MNEESNEKTESQDLLPKEIKECVESMDEVKAMCETQLDKLRKESMEQLTKVEKYLCSVNKSTNALLEKIDKHVLYTEKLEAEVQKNRTECENLELKNALSETHANIDMTVENIKYELTQSLDNLNRKLEQIKTLDNQVGEQIAAFKKDMTDTGTSEYAKLRTKCEAFLGNCNDRINEIKNEAVSFLSSCQKQNEQIIKMIPVKKEKFNTKDFVIYAISFLCSVNLILQIIMTLR